MPLDLDAYFARIGYHGAREPSLALLRALHARHPVAIPFENLDVLRGVPIDLEPAALERKLVAARRGGYCFEQNGLLAAVLRALEFTVIPLVARVRWQVPPEVEMARTHMVLQVEIAGVPWLADVGFGSLTATAPVRLDVETPQETPNEILRVVPAGHERLLQVQLDDVWQDLYRFTLEPALDVDYRVANWYTSTHPRSMFTQNLTVTRVGEGGERLALRNRLLTVRGRDGKTETPVKTPEALLQVLAERFGLHFAAGTRFGAPGQAWPT